MYVTAMTLSSLAADHVQRPRHRGPIDDANYGVAGTPGEGPYVEIWVRVDGDLIREAAFRSPGCPSSTAAASMLCELAQGRNASKIIELTGDELLLLLGGLPEGKEAYAEMSVQAMVAAIKFER